MKPIVRWGAVVVALGAAVVGGMTCLGGSLEPLPDAQRPASWAQPVDGGPGLGNLHQVDAGLYRSEQPTVEGFAAAHRLGIKTVINLRANHDDTDEIGTLPLRPIHIGMDTWALGDQHVIAFLKAAMEPANQPVLVHCQHGADRTGTLCAMYRICVQGWGRDEAILEMTRGGFGFHAIWQRLIEYVRTADIDRLRTAAGIAAPARAAVDPESPTQRDARRLVVELRAELERLTPRRFRRDVGVLWQGDAEFRAYLQKMVDEEFSAAEAEAQAALLVGLGLMAPGKDLRQVAIDTTVSQALAYYDHDRDAFVVVKSELPDQLRDPMYLHELQHAIQDQVLGLDDIIERAKAAKEDSDRGQALRFLWEGEARFVETVFTVARAGQGDLLTGAPAVADRVFRATPRRFEDLLGYAEQFMPYLGPEGQKMLAGMREAPPYLARMGAEVYETGAWSIYRVWRSGGWPAVDALWANPPTSTEQMLHPETKLLGDRRDEPVAVALPDLAPTLGEGWSRLGEDTMGEHGIAVLLSEQLPELRRGRAATGADGWGGDRVAAWRAPRGDRPVVTWLSWWDTADDAVQFLEAYRFAAEGRNLARQWPAAAVEIKGRSVAVVEGAEPALAARLAQALLAVPTPPGD